MAEKLLRNKGYRTMNVSYSHTPTNVVNNEVIEKEEKTITIFLKPEQQKKYYNDILSMNPQRIIFNPGSENEEFRTLALKRNIQVLSGCTIALLINSML